MDKNLVALLREDTRTVNITFVPRAEDGIPMEVGDDSGAPKYPSLPAGHLTYITHLDLKIGDTVVVPIGKRRVIGYVLSIDDKVEIEPNSKTKYLWVVAKVDLTGHEQNMARNREIEEKVASAYQRNLRRSFQQQVLGGIDDDSVRQSISALLSGPVAD